MRQLLPPNPEVGMYAEKTLFKDSFAVHGRGDNKKGVHVDATAWADERNLFF